MALTTTISKVTYVGNGSTTSFSVPFKFVEDSHIVVKVLTSTTETLWVDGTDYTLSGAGVDSGGTLTSTAAPAATETILIYRTVPLLQSLELVLTGAFNSENVEARFDLIYMLIQQLTEGIAPGSTTENLYLKFPDGEPSATSSTLPNLADRLGNVLSFDPVTGEPTVTDIDLTAVGGFTGPAAQVVGNMAIFSSTQGVAEQDDLIHRSLWDQQLIGYAGATEWDLSIGHIATITLGGNTTLTPSNIKTGVCKLIVTQDSTGGRTIAFATGFSNTDAVSLNTDSSAVTVLTFTSDGTNLIYEGSSQAAKTASGDVGAYRWFAHDFTGGNGLSTTISTEEDDAGYIVCNGKEASKTKYADLFAAIGTTYDTQGGAASPSAGNFRVPDLTSDNRFIRADTTVGTEEADLTAVNGLADSGHTHSYEEEGGAAVQISVGTSSPTLQSVDFANSGATTGSGTASLTGDAETRPINLTALPAIKF
jgi:hypothetical protein